MSNDDTLVLTAQPLSVEAFAPYGDVIAARISIEDGAFFKGGIDIRKPGGTDLKGGTATSAVASSEPVTAQA